MTSNVEPYRITSNVKPYIITNDVKPYRITSDNKPYRITSDDKITAFMVSPIEFQLTVSLIFESHLAVNPDNTYKYYRSLQLLSCERSTSHFYPNSVLECKSS